MLSIDAFIPVTPDDREFFADLYRRHPPVHSDMSLTTMLCWNHYAHYEYARVGEGVVIMSTIQGERSFRGPIGPPDPEALEAALDIAVREGGEVAYYIFDDATLDLVRSQYPTLPLRPDRDFADYVYRTEDLATLPGRDYLTIRKHLNRFRRECGPTVEAITPNLLGEVVGFLERWCEWRHCDESPVLAEEKTALRYAIAHFDDLGLEGIAVRVEGAIAGCALYDRLNEETAVVHFEKGLPDCEGIYRAVNQETAARLAGRSTFLNRESDLGLPGLREAKLRYHPHHMAEVHTARRADLEKRHL
ncbi:DUF2156 domain-containing protein [Methanofollis aquaemaris]|uniref:DUF2156 domain-containing protein n=1 Tax=Methanofollis aquaemaris TaxID=126734 RepID=A0A8A3S7F6_9EURY|nr:phosphatidylglycerol lysyltransferase domain-containing protein [Methanofollis aquaemaris]QSZ68065.1 DUF2156 domain-containing protein [Methanofollis aquaemaris]